MNDIKTFYKYDAVEDKDIFYREQDCEPIIKEVAQLKEVTDGRGNTSLGYFVGRIPAIIVEKYINEVGITFRDFIVDTTHVHRILNDPAYKKFRIFEGKV